MPSPTLPGPRIAYDRDGSIAFVSRNVGTERSPFQVQPTALQRLNADEFGGLTLTGDWWNIQPGMSDHFVSVMFPTPQNLVGWYASSRTRWVSVVGAVVYTSDLGLDTEFQVSRDTTNGLDGTWTSLAYKNGDADQLDFGSEMDGLTPDGGSASITYQVKESQSTSQGLDNPQYRDGTKEATGWEYLFGPAQRNVKGVRLYFPRKPDGAQSQYLFTLLHLHLYGTPDIDYATPNRMQVVDASTGDPKGDFNFGDLDYKNSITDTFKIKNLSSGLTAQGVVASVQENYPTGSGSSVQLSTDGGSTWHSSVSLGDLAPGASSATVTVQLDPVSGVLGQRFARIEAQVVGWA